MPSFCRDIFYHMSSIFLFLWWFLGWYAFFAEETCRSDAVSTASLVVLFMSLFEFCVVSCFCVASHLVKEMIKKEHPGHSTDQDTPLLYRAGYHSTWSDTSDVSAGNSQPLRRIAQMLHEPRRVSQMYTQPHQKSYDDDDVQQTLSEMLESSERDPIMFQIIRSE